jgi:N-acetylmuramoyl-L-alanine amidase CwlA
VAETKLPVDNEANTDGNRHFYGFEAINTGGGQDWPAAQVEAMVRVSAALCRAHEWKAESVIAHKEWQPGKPDPAGVDMGKLRVRVAERLRHPASWSPGVVKPPAPKPPAPKPTPVPSVEDRLASLEKRVTALEKG